MKNEEYKKLKVSEYIFISSSYAFIMGMLIHLTLKMREVPVFYFGILSVILMIWDKVLPKNKYVYIIRYTCWFIYVLYGIYGIYLSFK